MWHNRENNYLYICFIPSGNQKPEYSCIPKLHFFSQTITNLSVLAGHDVKPPKYVNQSHFNLQLGQSHAHTAAWPRSKRQIHKRVPAGLGFWSESETNTEFIVSISHRRNENKKEKWLRTACGKISIEHPQRGFEIIQDILWDTVQKFEDDNIF